MQLDKSKHVTRHYGSLRLIKTPQPSDNRKNWQPVAIVISANALVFFSNSFFFLPPPPNVQAKYWNSSVNEVEGTITDNKGKVIHRLFGKWHEAVFCGTPPSATCIWRASMTLFLLEKSFVHIYIYIRIYMMDFL